MSSYRYPDSYVFYRKLSHEYPKIVRGEGCYLLDADGIPPQITGRYRVGDIRHCFADITRARAVLAYEPQITLEAGLMELAGWLSSQRAFDRFAEASAELAERGLTV